MLGEVFCTCSLARVLWRSYFLVPLLPLYWCWWECYEGAALWCPSCHRFDVGKRDRWEEAGNQNSKLVQDWAPEWPGVMWDKGWAPWVMWDKGWAPGVMWDKGWAPGVMWDKLTHQVEKLQHKRVSASWANWSSWNAKLYTLQMGVASGVGRGQLNQILFQLVKRGKNKNTSFFNLWKRVGWGKLNFQTIQLENKKGGKLQRGQNKIKFFLNL